MRIFTTALAVCIWLCSGLCTPVYAQVLDLYLFTATPTNIYGPAGSTIGWGYSITNESPTYWLLGYDVHSSNPFLYGTATSFPFDYPVLSPGASMTVLYDGTDGLADLTWDTDAPIGFTNSGDFELTSYFYDDDPFLGGNQVSGPVTQNSPYSATVTAPTAVPEPSSKTLFAILITGACALFFGVWRRSLRPQT